MARLGNFLNWQTSAAETITVGDVTLTPSDKSCISSVAAYMKLEKHGFTHVRRYAGGLIDWEEAGLSLVGEMVE